MKTMPCFMGAVLAACLISGCGKTPKPSISTEAAAVDSPTVKEEPVQAAWTEEAGLYLPESMQKEIQLQTTRVEKQNQKSQQNLEFQIFREARERSLPAFDYRQGTAYATLRMEGKPGLVAGDSISVEKDGFSGTGSVSRILQIPPATSNLSEAIIAIPDPDKQLRLTEFVHVSIKSALAVTGLSVPESCVLATTEGTFAYRKEGENFRRIPVGLGEGGRGFAIVTQGLSEGDTVVVSPLKTLWLTELQLRHEGAAP